MCPRADIRVVGCVADATPGARFPRWDWREGGGTRWHLMCIGVPRSLVMNIAITSDLWAAFEDHIVWVAAALLVVAVL